MRFSFSTFLLFWQDIFSLDIITSSFSLHKLVFTQARVTVLLSDTSLVIIKQQWKSARNRTRENIKKPSKPASTHAPISPTVCDQWFNWNCSQESTCKSILFTHKYPLMVMNLLFSQLRQSAINFPMHNCLFFSPPQNKWDCPNNLPGLCIKGCKTATLSEAQLQQIERTGPVRTESVSPENYANSWGFTGPFLSSEICIPTSYGTDCSGNHLKSPRNPDTCLTDVISPEMCWKAHLEIYIAMPRLTHGGTAFFQAEACPPLPCSLRQI